MILNKCYIHPVPIKYQPNNIDYYKKIFLGRWCLDNGAEHDDDQTVLPYHWDDRKKLEFDFWKLNKIRLELLPQLANHLNELHEKNYSVLYWNIYVGNYFGIIIQIIYDRWETVRSCYESYPSSVMIGSRNLSLLSSDDNVEFFEKIVTDEWNEVIYSLAWEYLGGALKVQNNPSTPLVLNNPKKKKTGHIRNFSKKVLNYIFRILPNSKKLVLVNPHINHSIFVRLAIRLRAFISILFASSERVYIPLDIIKKSSKQVEFSTIDVDLKDFIRFFNSVINSMLPNCYVNSYNQIENDLIQFKNFFPEKIFLGCLHTDALINMWIAKAKEFGSQLYIGQHGGGYGTCKFAYSELFEHEISDKFLSWGYKKYDKTIPVGFFKANPFVYKKRKKNTKLLIVINCLPKYSYKLTAEPIGHQWDKYFDDVVRFASALNSIDESDIRFKTHSNDYGRNVFKRLKSVFPRSEIVSGGSMRHSCNGSKLVIITYNSTPIYEAIHSGMPTIIYLNPEYYELSDEFIEVCKILIDSKILHYNILSLKNHIMSVFESPHVWWDSEKVVLARQKFNQEFSLGSGVVDNLVQVLS